MKVKQNNFDPETRKKIIEIMEERRRQRLEMEENRKRVMAQQLYNVIGNRKFIIRGKLE